MAIGVNSTRLELTKVLSSFNNVKGVVAESLRMGGTKHGYVTTEMGSRHAKQAKVDLNSLHIEEVEPDSALPTTPFDGVTVTRFTFKPDGVIRDLSVLMRIKAASGQTPGIHTGTPYLIKDLRWEIGQASFVEHPDAVHFDTLFLTRKEEYDVRKKALLYGNFFEEQPQRNYHPRYVTLTNSTYEDILIPLGSWWFEKELDLRANGAPHITVQITWAAVTDFSNTPSVANTHVEVEPSYSRLLIQTTRPSKERSLAIRSVFRSSNVYTRVILPQKIEVPPITYVSAGTMTYNVGAGMPGLVSAIAFLLRPVSQGTPENETYADSAATDATASAALVWAGVGSTASLAATTNTANTQTAINAIKPGQTTAANLAFTGTTFLSTGDGAITFQGGLGGQPHASQGRPLVSVVTGATIGDTEVISTYEIDNPGVRQHRNFQGIPIDSVTMLVDGHTGIISTRPIREVILKEMTQEALSGGNPEAFLPDHDNAYYILPFTDAFAKDVQCGTLHGVQPITNQNIQLQIVTKPDALISSLYTLSGSWYLTVLAYKVAEFVFRPSANGQSTAQLNFIHPNTYM